MARTNASNVTSRSTASWATSLVTTASFLDLLVSRGIPLAGLCDAGEEGDFRLAVERAGLGSQLGRAGFYVCDADPRTS
jgi:hypothetical protein